MRRTLKTVDGKLVWDPPFTPEEEEKRKQNLKDMIETGVAPACHTDRGLLKGVAQQFSDDPSYGKLVRSVAEKMGRDTAGSMYLSGLARFPGDPEAFVDSRDDVKRICHQRGWGASGLVEVKADQREEPSQGGDIADDLLDDAVAREIQKNPDLAHQDTTDLREALRERMRPNWKED